MASAVPNTNVSTLRVKWKESLTISGTSYPVKIHVQLGEYSIHNLLNWGERSEPLFSQLDGQTDQSSGSNGLSVMTHCCAPSNGPNRQPYIHYPSNYLTVFAPHDAFVTLVVVVNNFYIKCQVPLICSVLFFSGCGALGPFCSVSCILCCSSFGDVTV